MSQDAGRRPLLTFEGADIPILPGQSLLDALLAAGYRVPHGCRSGICQSCLLRVTSGEVSPGARDGLAAGLRASRHVLACRTHAQGELAVSWPGTATQRHEIAVRSVEMLGPKLCRLRLKRPEGFDYLPGQYVTLWRDAVTCRAYSLASLPDEPCLEFHVRVYDDGALSSWLATRQTGDPVGLQGSMGDCVYRDVPDHAPLLLVGAGTGIAPLWGILRDALRAGHTGPIRVLHAVSDRSRAYLDTELRQLALRHDRVQYDVVAGRGMEAVIAALQASSSFAGWRIFLCGAPAIVTTLRRHLFLAGAASRDILADPFFSPG